MTHKRMNRLGAIAATLAVAVLLGGNAVALPEAGVGLQGLVPDKGDLQYIKKRASDKDCCKACITPPNGKKVCRTLCGADAKTACELASQQGDESKTGSETKTKKEKKETKKKDTKKEETKKEATKKEPEFKIEDERCYPICRDKCIVTRTNMTWEQCLQDCLITTRC